MIIYLYPIRLIIDRIPFASRSTHFSTFMHSRTHTIFFSLSFGNCFSVALIRSLDCNTQLHHHLYHHLLLLIFLFLSITALMLPRCVRENCSFPVCIRVVVAAPAPERCFSFRTPTAPINTNASRCPTTTTLYCIIYR